MSQSATGGALDGAIVRVVESGNCSGCGACTLLDDGLSMELDASGYARPVRTGASADNVGADAAGRFEAICPGVVVRAVHPAGAARHPTMGSYFGVWRAWATDPAIRLRGSSGGVLTALSAFIVDTGQASAVVGARAAKADPRRTVSVSITTRAEALESAGSRYAPASNAAFAGGAGAIVGKPCEASALRAMGAPRDGVEPLLLSFFCAGTPSQQATDTLLSDLGLSPDEPIDDLWYRGHGWPGSFTAVAGTERVEASYDRSWGQFLGPTMQWRCKVCADGVGESSDVSAADFWRVDGRGYPDFAEGPGFSALIARTHRGQELIERAVSEGVIAVEPIGIDDLAAVQPFQRRRREQLAGRLAGARAAGQPVPRYRGFGLVRLAMGRPRESVRTLRGSFRRVRSTRRAARS